MVEAKRQKDCFMEEIRKIKASIVEIVDIDDICENGIVCEMDKVNAIVDKMKNRKIDALFFPFCDFGEEQVVAAIASKFTVPILIWGPRDERPNTDEARGRDTQCGMFAATKVLQRYGLKYSYIYNCTTKSEEFLKGYETFIRTAAVLKSLRTLRIAKIGERPVPFMSVMTNEANLIKRFGITTVPISPVEICNRARKILEEKGKEYIKYEEEFVRKFPDGENYQQICATKLAVQELMEENNCSVAAFECWSAFPTLMGLCPCVVLGEMADNGMPLSCETDINGAITLAILRACNLFEESEFLADLTIGVGIMREIQVQKLTKDNFGKYGEFLDLLDESELKKKSIFQEGFFADVVALEFNQGNQPTISVCHVKKQSENIISFLEAHQYACEGLLPLDGDVIIFVGIMDSDFRTESIEAFYVPKGTFVKLNPLIVHGTQYPVDKEDVHIVCMLPGRTFKNDMLSRRLETGEQIRITRGYKK